MTEMIAIAITTPGGPEVLKPVRLARPEPGTGEILVKVAAAGVNRPDILQRQGGYPPPPGAPATPGLEIAGEVVALGAGRQALPDRRPGLRAGAGRRLCRISVLRLRTMPCRFRGLLSLVEAAGIPETFFTVWTNVFDRGAAQAGRDLSRAWRLERHRHDRDHACQGVRSAGLRHRRIA